MIYMNICAYCAGTASKTFLTVIGIIHRHAEVVLNHTLHTFANNPSGSQHDITMLASHAIVHSNNDGCALGWHEINFTEVPNNTMIVNLQ